MELAERRDERLGWPDGALRVFERIGFINEEVIGDGDGDTGGDVIELEGEWDTTFFLKNLPKIFLAPDALGGGSP